MENKTAKAYLRYVRISPRKVQIVCDLIRGKSVAQANAILMGTPKAASELLLKLLKLLLMHPAFISFGGKFIQIFQSSGTCHSHIFVQIDLFRFFPEFLFVVFNDHPHTLHLLRIVCDLCIAVSQI